MSEPQMPADEKNGGEAGKRASEPGTGSASKPRTAAQVSPPAKSKSAQKRAVKNARSDTDNKPALQKAPSAGQRTSAGVSAEPLSQVLTIAIAAVLGAGLALSALFVLDLSGIDGPAATNESAVADQISARLEPIERDVGAIRAGTAQRHELAALEAQVAEVQTRIAALDTQGTGEGSATAGEISGLTSTVGALDHQLTELNDRISRLEGAVPGDLQAQLAALVAQTDLAVLEARVAELEENQLANDMRRAALALGLAQLSRAAQSSDPFVVEFDAISRLRPGDPYLTQLGSIARTGAATEAMLAVEFGPMARRVIRANRRTSSESQWAKFWSWLSGLFTLRRTGEISGEGVDAILARAELRLAEDNLSAAAREVANLPTPVQEHAEPWLTAAQGRVRLNQLITALSIDVLDELNQ